MRQKLPWRHPSRRLAGVSRAMTMATGHKGDGRRPLLENYRWATTRPGRPSPILVPWKFHLWLAHLLPLGLGVIILTLALPFSRFYLPFFLEHLEITFKKSEKGLK